MLQKLKNAKQFSEGQNDYNVKWRDCSDWAVGYINNRLINKDEKNEEKKLGRWVTCQTNYIIYNNARSLQWCSCYDKPSYLGNSIIGSLVMATPILLEGEPPLLLLFLRCTVKLLEVLLPLRTSHWILCVFIMVIASSPMMLFIHALHSTITGVSRNTCDKIAKRK